MNVEFLLADLRQQDIRVGIVGDKLEVSAPPGTMNPELLQKLTVHKNDVIDLLKSTEPTIQNGDRRAAERDSIKDWAVEVWSTAGGRIWIVADEEDARLAEERLGISRGEIWTCKEIESVARIEDRALAKEVAAWKRRFNGTIIDESPAKSNGGGKR